MGVLGGFFASLLADEAHAAVEHVARPGRAGHDVRPAVLDGAGEARSAAFCLTAMEGAACTAPI
jgi:hypothetical protein